MTAWNRSAPSGHFPPTFVRKCIRAHTMVMNMKRLQPVLLGVAIVAAVTAFMSKGVQPIEASQGGQQNLLETGKIDGAGSCVRCHTQPTANDISDGALELVLLTEYPTWKTLDKHAQAYAVLEGPRGENMGKILGKKVTDEATGCIGCHGTNVPKERQGDSFNVKEGVSCGGCHGPSGEWFRPHQNKSWRQVSPEEKEQKGMRDVRHPVKRAEMCYSCHIGNPAEGKVVTHEMFAAGHPPLPSIDVATFSENEPQHWRNLKDVPAFKNASEALRARYGWKDFTFQQTKMAIVGSVVALRETMRLVKERAAVEAPKGNAGKLWPELVGSGAGAGEAKSRWPEIAMAHSDCFACHHDLKYPGWRQERGYVFRLPNDEIHTTPGRPMVRSWSVGFVELAMRLVDTSETAYVARGQRFSGAMRELANACNATPFGDAQQVHSAADKVIAECQTLIDLLMKAEYSPNTAKLLLGHLGTLKASHFADFDTARIFASLFQVVLKDLKGADNAIDPSLARQLEQDFAKLQTELSIHPYIERPKRQKLINDMLREIAKKKDVAGIDQFYDALKPSNLGNIKLQESLKDNAFLNMIRSDVASRDVTQAFVSPKFVADFQQFGDEELGVFFDNMNRSYNPERFQKAIQTLTSSFRGK